jgi:hypothetical protein
VIQNYDAQRNRCPLSALTTHMGKATPATREILRELYDSWSQYLSAGVQALKDSGEIDANTDVDTAATAGLPGVVQARRKPVERARLSPAKANAERRRARRR